MTDLFTPAPAQVIEAAEDPSRARLAARRAVLGLGALTVLGVVAGTGTEQAQAAISTKVDRKAVLKTARSGIGVRYKYGGTTRSGWDCSGFTRWVYKKHGVTLAHSAKAQKKAGKVVSKKSAVAGDLVYWPGHIGVYAGNGTVIDAGNKRVGTSHRKIWGSPVYVRIGR